ncbi:SDR family NAD(P)-dependent oxidoreductase [Belnapia rosea]|nr:SDR family NAD(P)-dependent oxidoreductase [Belnapia rosea]SDB22342.1 short chain dehydrogenase [Belnapia rosea]
MEVIVITGGSRGIGAATARACASCGLGVILTYNSPVFGSKRHQNEA